MAEYSTRGHSWPAAADRSWESGCSTTEVAARLDTSVEEDADLRVRLELTERAQCTLADERRQALRDFEEERRWREEAEREREDLRRELEALSEARESPVDLGPTEKERSYPTPPQRLRRSPRAWRRYNRRRLENTARGG